MPTIAAKPYDYTFDAERLALVIIDMQRDFIEPGGFGAALGNDVSRLAPIVPAVARLLDAFRKHGPARSSTPRNAIDPTWPIARRPSVTRGKPAACASATPGPMGRILIDGEPGNDFVRGAASRSPARSSSPSRARGRSTPPISRKSCKAAASPICCSPA